MMTTTDLLCEFFVAGLAVAQPRAQQGQHGRFMAKRDHPVHAWRMGVKYEAQRAWGGRAPALGPVRLEASFRFPRPRGMPDDAPLEFDRKPDYDNLIKSAMDAVKRVLWMDDCQVCLAFILKRYARPGEPPGAAFRVKVARITKETW